MRRLKWQGRGKRRSDGEVPDSRWNNRWPSVVIRCSLYETKWTVRFRWPRAWCGPDTPTLPDLNRTFASRAKARAVAETEFAKMAPAIERWNEDLRNAEKERQEAQQEEQRREREALDKDQRFCLLLKERLNIVAEGHKEPGWIVVDVRSLTKYLQRVGVPTD